MTPTAQIQRFLGGENPLCALNRSRRRPPRLLFPGAFNPLHWAHRQMAEIASELRGEPAEFELSIENVDKATLDLQEIERRLQQFSAHQPVWLTRAPTFAEKSAQFPGATFVVGSDTLRRIAQPKYYGGDPQAVIAAVRSISDNDCRLLVFGRLIEDAFRTLDDLSVAEPLKQICDSVPESVFRADISSTLLRQVLRQTEQETHRPKRELDG